MHLICTCHFAYTVTGRNVLGYVARYASPVLNGVEVSHLHLRQLFLAKYLNQGRKYDNYACIPIKGQLLSEWMGRPSVSLLLPAVLHPPSIYLKYANKTADHRKPR